MIDHNPLKLSTNFSLSEFLESQTAERTGGIMLELQLNPPESIIKNLRYHVIMTVQKARNYFGCSIRISSGYRNEILNKAAKGSDTSQHCKGEASDEILSDRFLEMPVNERKAELDALILSITNKSVREDVNSSFYLWAFYCIFRHKCDIDQVIHEYGSDGKPAWVHASSSTTSNKAEMLIKRTGQNYRRLTLEEALLLGC